MKNNIFRFLSYLLIIVGVIFILHLYNTSIDKVDTKAFFWCLLFGAVASFIKSSLGMGYGASVSSFLMGYGIPPIASSAYVHIAEIFTTGSEIIKYDLRFQKYKGKLDFAFTSPPYFDRERYSDDDTQSFKKFGNYESWRDGFLRPTLETIYEYLRNDRYICWNIADIKVGPDKFYPLEQDSIDILTELGMEYRGKLRMTMSPMTGMDLSKARNSMQIGGQYYKYEPIFIFYKR